MGSADKQLARKLQSEVLYSACLLDETMTLRRRLFILNIAFRALRHGR